MGTREKGLHVMVQPTPEVGMGATAGYGSDCYPYTIVAVSASGKRITVQQDTATLVSAPGPIGSHQEYMYTANPEAQKRVYSLRKNGYWYPIGTDTHSGGGLAVGSRRYYQDPSF